MNVLKVKRLTPTAKLPECANAGDMYDIFADEDKVIGAVPCIVKTGIALDIPAGFRVKLYNRSSNPLKNDLIVSNGVGIIDTGYKHELGVIFHGRTGHITGVVAEVKRGQKIAQICLEKVEDFTIEEVAELNMSNDRGGGFGSTGK